MPIRHDRNRVRWPIINEHGTTIRNETITKVLVFPLPIYFRQLRGFIGLVNYFREHVYANLSVVVKPFQQLLEEIGMN